MQTSPIVGPSKFGCVNSPSVRLETRISPRGSWHYGCGHALDVVGTGLEPRSNTVFWEDSLDARGEHRWSVVPGCPCGYGFPRWGVALLSCPWRSPRGFRHQTGGPAQWVQTSQGEMGEDSCSR